MIFFPQRRGLQKILQFYLKLHRFTFNFLTKITDSKNCLYNWKNIKTISMPDVFGDLGKI